MKKKTTAEFIAEAEVEHNHKYGYDRTDYKNKNTKICIYCPDCVEYFWQAPANHLKKQGCPNCGNKSRSKTKTKSQQEFIDQANQRHNHKYGYDRTEYKNDRIKVCIYCPECKQDFWQTPSGHLRGRGCPNCGNKSRSKTKTKSQQEFIDQANQRHNHKYGYEKADYKGALKKVTIICNKCTNEFQQRPACHLKGRSCPLCCDSSISKGETCWLDSLGIPPQNRNKRLWLTPVRFIMPDGYDPATNTIYEYHGDFWHGNPKYYNPEDINPRRNRTFGELYQETVEREATIRTAGYNLVTIWESEFTDRAPKPKG